MGEVASLMPDFPWIWGLLGAWKLMTVDGLPFLIRARSSECGGRWLKMAKYWLERQWPISARNASGTSR